MRALALESGFCCPQAGKRSHVITLMTKGDTGLQSDTVGQGVTAGAYGSPGYRDLGTEPAPEPGTGRWVLSLFRSALGPELRAPWA